MIVIPEESMPQSLLVSILGAMHALYTNIELREAVPEKAKKAEGLGVWSSCAKQMQVCLRFLQRLCVEFIFMFPDLISILDSTTCNQAGRGQNSLPGYFGSRSRTNGTAKG